MHLLYAVLVIMYLGAPVLGVPPVIPYNCKVQVPECQNSGVCDPVAKTCDCGGTGFGGVDCSIPDTPTACVTATCENGGTCDNEICYCTGDYTGADCTTPVVSAVCSATGMTVTFTPGYTFTGLFNVNGFPTCTSGLMVPYTGGSCGGDYTVATYTDPAGDYYKVPFKIQYNAIAEADNDLIIEVYCEDSPSTPFSAEFNVLNVDPDTVDVALTTLTGTFIKVAGMSMGVQKEDGTALAPGDTVNVGDVLDVVFILEVGAYTQTKWGTLVVGDAEVPTNILTVLTDGCVNPDGQEIFVGVDTDVSDPALKTLTTKISVVKFLDSTELNIAMTGTGCDDVDVECDLGACDPAIYAFRNVLPNEFGTKGLVRRRRRAAGDESGGNSLSGSINITLNVQSLRDDLNAIKNKLDKDGTATSCMRSIVFLIPMILLALMLLISMAMTLYFCLKVTRRRDKDDREFGPAVNMGYKA